MTTTLARRTDPDTSHEAAAKQTPRKTEVVRAAVLEILTEDGPATHDQIIARYGHRAMSDAGLPIASASSIRTRCAELVEAGLVRRAEGVSGRSNMGNRAAVWEVVTAPAAAPTHA